MTTKGLPENIILYNISNVEKLKKGFFLSLNIPLPKLTQLFYSKKYVHAI